MKWSLMFIVGVVLLVEIVFLVSATYVQIEPKEVKTLTSKNGICEYYQEEFSIGEIDAIIINGETINIEYLGDKNWKVNDYEGKLNGHNFFVYNDKPKLKGVRFDFGHMNEGMPDGNFGLTEEEYYPWDCQGKRSGGGLTIEINIKEGWNLVPKGISLRDCYYAYEGELCKEDVLVQYTYIPTMNKYFTEKEFSELDEENLDPKFIEYFSEKVFSKMSPKWIYIKPGAGDKKVIGNFGAYYTNRDSYLSNNVLKLYSGWNFLTVDAFMIYDDNWNENPLSMEDMAGSCTIEKLYGWDYLDQNWERFSVENNFDDDMLGGGFVVKVSDDCALGYSGSSSGGTSPPGLPGDTQISDYIVESDIGDAIFRSSSSGLDDDCIVSDKSCSRRYDGLYRYNEKDISLIVEFDSLSLDNFRSIIKSRFTNVQEGNFVGEDYYIINVENDVLIIWKSNDKIVALEYDRGADEEADILEDILTVYLPKYPSDLTF